MKNDNTDYYFSEEEYKKLKDEYAAKHPSFSCHSHSMCIFKRKRALRRNNYVEKKYRVNLDSISFQDNVTKKTTRYWNIGYFIDDEPFDHSKHSKQELDMMFEWVEKRKAHFESYGDEIILWRY